MQSKFPWFPSRRLDHESLDYGTKGSEALNPWLTLGGKKESGGFILFHLEHSEWWILKGCVHSELRFHEYIFHTQSITRLYTHSHNQQSHLWKNWSSGFNCANVWCLAWKSSAWRLTAQWQSVLDGYLAAASPAPSAEWWVVCKLFHIGSDLLISKHWHRGPLSWVCTLLAEWWLFHHLIDISSLLYFPFFPSTANCPSKRQLCGWRLSFPT